MQLLIDKINIWCFFFQFNSIGLLLQRWKTQHFIIVHASVFATNALARSVPINFNVGATLFGKWSVLEIFYEILGAALRTLLVVSIALCAKLFQSK